MRAELNRKLESLVWEERLKRRKWILRGVVVLLIALAPTFYAVPISTRTEVGTVSSEIATQCRIARSLATCQWCAVNLNSGQHVVARCWRNIQPGETVQVHVDSTLLFGVQRYWIAKR